MLVSACKPWFCYLRREGGEGGNFCFCLHEMVPPPYMSPGLNYSFAWVWISFSRVPVPPTSTSVAYLSCTAVSSSSYAGFYRRFSHTGVRGGWGGFKLTTHHTNTVLFSSLGGLSLCLCSPAVPILVPPRPQRFALLSPFAFAFAPRRDAHIHGFLNRPHINPQTSLHPALK